MTPPSDPVLTPAQTPNDVSTPRRVLLVEDNLLVCLALRGVLEEAGFSVAVMDNGLAAWESLRDGTQAPHVVLSDLTLPGLSGRELLSRIRTLARPVPVAVISGHADGQMEEELLGLGAVAVIGKPVMPSELVRTVHDVLGRS